MTKPENPIVHKLKILPKYFAAVCAGTKRAELRKNDRDYRAGDVLILEEALPGSDMTGKSVCVRITHVADVSNYAPGYVLLSIAQVWIPCSKRTPENIPGSCKEYLVFDALNNKVHHDYWVVPDGDSAPVTSFWSHYGAHVTHWMPLPEPPVNITVKE
jgi:hypothetical protein